MGKNEEKAAGKDLPDTTSPMAQMLNVGMRKGVYVRPVDVDQGDEYRKLQAVKAGAQIRVDQAGGPGESHEADNALRIATRNLDTFGELAAIRIHFKPVPTARMAEVIRETTAPDGTQDIYQFTIALMSDAITKVELPDGTKLDGLSVADIDAMFSTTDSGWSDADYSGMTEVLNRVNQGDNHVTWEATGND